MEEWIGLAFIVVKNVWGGSFPVSRAFLRAMGKKNNQKMIRMSIESCILRYPVKEKNALETMHR